LSGGADKEETERRHLEPLSQKQLEEVVTPLLRRASSSSLEVKPGNPARLPGFSFHGTCSAFLSDNLSA
jgi:hypothetical protein